MTLPYKGVSKQCNKRKFTLHKQNKPPFSRNGAYFA